MTLPNGFQICMESIQGVPLVTVLMMVKTGSIHETWETNGVSHLVEKMLFRKSSQYRDVRAAINQIGGKYQSGVTRDFTYFSISAISSDMQSILNIFMDVLKSAQFNDSLLSEGKQQVFSLIQGKEKNPNYKWQSLMLNSLYPDHPYRLMPHGNRANIEKMDTKQAESFFHKYYQPDQVFFIIAGDFKEKVIRNQVRETFSSFREPSVKIAEIINAPKIHQSHTKIDTHSLKKDVAFISVGWQAPSVQNVHTYAVDVLLGSLGLGESSRLNMHIRESLPGIYYIWADYATRRYPGYLTMTAICDPNMALEAQGAMLREMKIIRNDGIPDGEIIKAKQYLNAYAGYAREGSFDTAFYMGYWMATGGRPALQDYLTRINQVEPDQVQMVAKEYFRNDNYISVILYPQ